RDSDCDPGPIVQRRRLSLLPGQSRVLRRAARRSAADPLHPAGRLYGSQRRLTDLESGVLRKHDRGERPDVALSRRRATGLSLPLSPRLGLAIPDPEALEKRLAVLADRRRRRVPAGPGEARSTADGPGRAGRGDRGFHERGWGE